ncbi:MAG: hypothetical protein Q4G45_11235 [Actinomycetia bacterium]|nr:hypothetical protein [Actinomycetes bacterium]
MGIFSWLRGGTATLEPAGQGRRDPTRLPRTIVADLDFFGRFWIRRTEASPAAEAQALSLCGSLTTYASADPERFCAELRAVAEPVGGWVEYGAMRLIHELLGPLDNPHTDYLMESSLAFLRSRQIPWSNLTADAHSWWAMNLPGVDWLPRRPVPAPGATPISLLPMGHERLVATVEFNSSQFVVRHEPGAYVAYQRYPDDLSDPIDFADAAAPDLYQLYVAIGTGFTSVPDWVDRELEPFVTVQRGDFS